MPITTVTEVKVRAERVGSALREEVPGVTLSIGIADTSDGVCEAQLLRCNADAALYSGKEKGRDTIVGFDHLIARHAQQQVLTVDRRSRTSFQRDAALALFVDGFVAPA